MKALWVGLLLPFYSIPLPVPASWLKLMEAATTTGVMLGLRPTERTQLALLLLRLYYSQVRGTGLVFMELKINLGGQEFW